MQKQKPSLLEQLEEHRRRKARAMRRFELAQARIAQVEERLQSLHEQSQAPCSNSPTQQGPPPSALATYPPSSGDPEQRSFTPGEQTEALSQSQHPSRLWQWSLSAVESSAFVRSGNIAPEQA